MRWTCPSCKQVYEVPPGKAIECLCEVEFVPAPPGAEPSTKYPGPTFRGIPNIQRSPVNQEE